MTVQTSYPTRLQEIDDELGGLTTYLAEKLRLREEIEREIVEIREDMSELQRHRDWLARKAGMTPVSTELPRSLPLSPPIRETMAIPPRLLLVANSSHGRMAEAILEENGRDMKVTEIIDQMERAGHSLPPIPNIRFNTVYSAMNRRRDVFLKTEKGYWGLVPRRKSPEAEVILHAPQEEDLALEEDPCLDEPEQYNANGSR